jgi:hypothetical protein
MNTLGWSKAYLAQAKVALQSGPSLRLPIRSPFKAQFLTATFPLTDIGAKLVLPGSPCALGENNATLLAEIVPGNSLRFCGALGRAVFSLPAAPSVGPIRKFLAARLAFVGRTRRSISILPLASAFRGAKLKRAALSGGKSDPLCFYDAAVLAIERLVMACLSHRLTLKAQTPTQARLSRSHGGPGPACGEMKNAPYRVATSTLLV